MNICCNLKKVLLLVPNRVITGIFINTSNSRSTGSVTINKPGTLTPPFGATKRNHMPFDLTCNFNLLA